MNCGAIPAIYNIITSAIIAAIYLDRFTTINGRYSHPAAEHSWPMPPPTRWPRSSNASAPPLAGDLEGRDSTASDSDMI
jgi:hypothetical protein